MPLLLRDLAATGTRRVMRIHFRRRRRAALLVVVLLAAVGVAWVLFSPLLFDDVVDEPFPTATTQ